jgi:hypothetical protein
MSPAEMKAQEIARCVRGCTTDQQYQDLVQAIAAALNSPTPPGQDARVAFEAHAKRRRLQVDRSPHRGDYFQPNTSRHWVTWQAAWQAALTSPQAAAGVDGWSKMRNALRDLAVKKCERMVTGGGFVPNGLLCTLCQAECEDGALLVHKSDCLLSATPSPAPAARAGLSADDRAEIEAANAWISAVPSRSAAVQTGDFHIQRLLAIIDRLAPLPAATEGEK